MNTEVRRMVNARSLIGAKWEKLYFATIGALPVTWFMFLRY